VRKPTLYHSQTIHFFGSGSACFFVTLDYRIDIYIQGSNYNIFDIKTFYAVMNLLVVE
jgi:hypothetical protein